MAVVDLIPTSFCKLRVRFEIIVLFVYVSFWSVLSPSSVTQQMAARLLLAANHPQKSTITKFGNHFKTDS